MIDVIFYKNSVDVYVKNYRRAIDNSEITDGVLTWTITDIASNNLVGGPFTMLYIGANGHYRGSSGLINGLVVGNQYLVEANDSKYVSDWQGVFICQPRPFRN